MVGSSLFRAAPRHRNEEDYSLDSNTTSSNAFTKPSYSSSYARRYRSFDDSTVIHKDDRRYSSTDYRNHRHGESKGNKRYRRKYRHNRYSIRRWDTYDSGTYSSVITPMFHFRSFSEDTEDGFSLRYDDRDDEWTSTGISEDQYNDEFSEDSYEHTTVSSVYDQSFVQPFQNSSRKELSRERHQPRVHSGSGKQRTSTKYGRNRYGGRHIACREWSPDYDSLSETGNDDESTSNGMRSLGYRYTNDGSTATSIPYNTHHRSDKSIEPSVIVAPSRNSDAEQKETLVSKKTEIHRNIVESDQIGAPPHTPPGFWTFFAISRSEGRSTENANDDKHKEVGGEDSVEVSRSLDVDAVASDLVQQTAENESEGIQTNGFKSSGSVRTEELVESTRNGLFPRRSHSIDSDTEDEGIECSLSEFVRTRDMLIQDEGKDMGKRSGYEKQRLKDFFTPFRKKNVQRDTKLQQDVARKSASERLDSADLQISALGAAKSSATTNFSKIPQTFPMPRPTLNVLAGISERDPLQSPLSKPAKMLKHDKTRIPDVLPLPRAVKMPYSSRGKRRWSRDSRKGSRKSTIESAKLPKVIEEHSSSDSDALRRNADQVFETIPPSETKKSGGSKETVKENVLEITCENFSSASLGTEKNLVLENEQVGLRLSSDELRPTPVIPDTTVEITTSKAVDLGLSTETSEESQRVSNGGVFSLFSRKLSEKAPRKGQLRSEVVKSKAAKIMTLSKRRKKKIGRGGLQVSNPTDTTTIEARNQVYLQRLDILHVMGKKTHALADDTTAMGDSTTQRADTDMKSSCGAWGAIF